MTKKKYGIRTVNGNEPDPETGNVELSVGGSQPTPNLLDVNQAGNYTDKDIQFGYTNDRNDWISSVGINGLGWNKFSGGGGRNFSMYVSPSYGLYMYPQEGNTTGGVAYIENCIKYYAPYGSSAYSTLHAPQTFYEGTYPTFLLPSKNNSNVYTLATLDDISNQQGINEILNTSQDAIDKQINLSTTANSNKTYVTPNFLIMETDGYSASILSTGYANDGTNVRTNGTLNLNAKLDSNPEITNTIIPTVEPGSANTIYKLPYNDVNGKTVTLASLDDIINSGTSTLQSILSAGHYAANLDLGLYSNSSNAYTTLSYNGKIEMGSFANGQQYISKLYAHALQFQEYGDLGQYRITLEAPINKPWGNNFVSYYFPEKTNGNYTLATTDQLVAHTLQETVTAGNTITNGTPIINEYGDNDKVVIGFSSVQVYGENDRLVQLDARALLFQKGGQRAVLYGEGGNGTYFLPTKATGNYDLATTSDLAIDDPTIWSISKTELNTKYPNAVNGFRVHCPYISTGAMIYEKASIGWLQYAVTITQ